MESDYKPSAAEVAFHQSFLKSGTSESGTSKKEHPVSKKFDFHTEVILHGRNAAVEKLTLTPNGQLSDSDCAGKYHAIADQCERSGLWKAASEARSRARRIDNGQRSISDK